MDTQKSPRPRQPSHGRPVFSPSEGPLVLHVRSFRQFYGARSLTIRELARLAGVHRDTVQAYETMRRLPRAIEVHYRLSVALRRSMHQLFPDWLKDEVMADIEVRRMEMGLDTEEDHRRILEE